MRVTFVLAHGSLSEKRFPHFTVLKSVRETVIVSVLSESTEDSIKELVENGNSVASLIELFEKTNP